MLWLPRARAQLTPAFLGASRKVAAAAGCPSTPSSENDGTAYYRSFGGGNIYAGQAMWNDGGTPRAICRLDFELEGNGTGYTWNAEIHAVSGVYDLNTTALATSSNVTGSNWATATWVQFDFSSPYTTSASTSYHLVVRPTVAMGGNDMGLHGSGTGMTGYSDVFSAAGAASNAGGDDASIKIYWQS